MIQLPSYVNFIAAENAAAGMVRGLVERTQAWGSLVAQAQRILTEVQNELSRRQWEFQPAAYYDPVYCAPLISAARVLDAAASANSLDDKHRQRLAICAAAAFAMYGNFPSAAAALNSHAELEGQNSTLVWLAIGCFSPRHLGKARLVALQQKDELCSDATELLQGYLATADHALIRRFDRTILQAYDHCADNFESVLLGYARVATRHMALLSTRNALQSALPASVVARLLDAEVFTLLPSQYEVLCNSAFLSSTSNSLICLPTSTGKTLIGEVAIAKALAQRPGLAIYIAPYVAIGAQAARALKRHLPPGYRVHTLVGGLSSELPINSTIHREVVVTTPERLDSILRHFSNMDELRIVVMDEAHIVADGVRGAKVEALLSRLRLQQHSGLAFRIVALSAVMAHSERFREWLGVPDEMFHTCLWRPTARRVAVWRSNNKLTWLYAGDELRPPGVQPTHIFGSRSLVWPASMYPAHDFARMKVQSSALFTNTAYLCRQMYEEYQEPILCVCASRSSSRGIAAKLAEDFEPYQVFDEVIIELIQFIETKAQHLFGLKQCLLSGVAYHNAALPLRLRQLIERAVENRVLRVVCATTTLAEGVDLPFRVTVLAEWLQWRMDTRDQQRPFGALKFRNIAGRAGRAGVFTEGDTVVFENLLGPSRFVDHQNRAGAILSMMETPREVQSALEEEEIFPIELEARKRVLSSNFLAAIRENPRDENLDKSFADALLFRELPTGQSAEQMVSQIRSDVLEGGDRAFAIAASPLHLTALGQAANSSRFSPESVRQIISAMETLEASIGFEDIASELLGALGALPEQQNSDWTKAVSKSSTRFVVKAADLALVISMWRSGLTIAQMFGELPAVKRSKAKDNVSEWLSGARVSENWAGNFDKFADFIESVIEGYLPWLLDACSSLSAVMATIGRHVPWEEFVSIVNETIDRRRVAARLVGEEEAPEED